MLSISFHVTLFSHPSIYFYFLKYEPIQLFIHKYRNYQVNVIVFRSPWMIIQSERKVESGSFPFHWTTAESLATICPTKAEMSHWELRAFSCFFILAFFPKVAHLVLNIFMYNSRNMAKGSCRSLYDLFPRSCNFQFHWAGGRGA